MKFSHIYIGSKICFPRDHFDIITFVKFLYLLGVSLGHIAQHRAAFLGFSEQCDNDLQVVIANRDMGSTAVLRVTAVETQAME